MAAKTSDVRDERRTIAFLGGTGPLGRGLALRLAVAGHTCILGSRDASRAEEAAAGVVEIAGSGLEARNPEPGGPEGSVAGAANIDAVAGADMVVVSVPYDAMAATLTDVRDEVGDSIVICCVNALDFDRAGPRPRRVEGGSAAQECQELLPRARVVGAFHHLSAVSLLKPGEPLDCDVLVLGDDAAANDAVAALVDELGGARPIHAGPLRLSQPVEDLTAVLIAVNKRYRAHAGIRLTDVGAAPR